jgi:hypothetical protein
MRNNQKIRPLKEPFPITKGSNAMYTEGIKQREAD